VRYSLNVKATNGVRLHASILCATYFFFY
jgi:hypothetical protein